MTSSRGSWGQLCDHTTRGIRQKLGHLGVMYSKEPTVQGRLFGPGTSSVAHLTKTLSSTLLNEVVVSYTASHISMTTRPAAGVKFSARDRDQWTPRVPFQQLLCRHAAELRGTCQAGCRAFRYIPGNLATGGAFSVDSGYAPWQLAGPNWSGTIRSHSPAHPADGSAEAILRCNETRSTLPTAPDTGDVQGLLSFSNFGLANFATGNRYQPSGARSLRSSKTARSGNITTVMN